MNYVHHNSISGSDFPIFLITKGPWIKSLVLENFSKYQPMNQFCLVGGQKQVITADKTNYLKKPLSNSWFPAKMSPWICRFTTIIEFSITHAEVRGRGEAKYRMVILYFAIFVAIPTVISSVSVCLLVCCFGCLSDCLFFTF